MFKEKICFNILKLSFQSTKKKNSLSIGYPKNLAVEWLKNDFYSS